MITFGTQMQVYIILPLECAHVTAFFDGRGFAEHHLSRLVKMLIPLNHMVYLDQIFHTYLFN